MSYSPMGRTRSRSSTVSSASREPISIKAAPLGISAKPSSSSTSSSALAHDAADSLSGWNNSTNSNSTAPELRLSTSQHTLKTIRGVRRTESSDGTSDDGESSSAASIKRGNPNFVLDLVPSPTNEFSTSASNAFANSTSSRPRASTFGGVPLPEAPSAKISSSSSKPTTLLNKPPNKTDDDSTTTNRPYLTRTRSDSSLNSIPSSLHLGGDSFATRRPVLYAGLKAAALFVLSLVALYILLKTLLPPIDEEHRSAVKLPKSFDDLKALNVVLQIYKDRHYNRVLGCYVTVYMFLQAFSIPGSMYLSILGGALYGLYALPLVCFCVATGALLCYFISQTLGPAVLLNSDKWQRRVDAWTARIAKHNDNLISYLIVLRIAPVPPHFLLNVVAPHLGISVYKFWVSTFFGIMGVSYIHVTIGTTLDQMTSSSDFHLISWQNGLGLAGIVVAVLVPVLMKRYWKSDLDQAAAEPDPEEVQQGAEVRRRSSERYRTERVASVLPVYHDHHSSSSSLLNSAKTKVARPFELGNDDDDDDLDDDDDGRRAAWSGSNGNSNKASRVLGINVVK